MRKLRTVSELRTCRRGNALVIVATTAPLLIAASAIGLDTIQVTLAKRQLQRSADSAAMAGAYAVARKGTATAAAAAADRDLSHNNQMVLDSPRIVENAPQSGAFRGDARAVRVVLKTKRSVPFISFFTGGTMDVQVEATAAAMPDGRYCVVSLEKENSNGVDFTGGGLTNLGCGVATNSPSGQAITVSGDAQVTASPIAAIGGVPPASSFVGTTTVIPNSLPVSDPYANLPAPTPPSPCNDAVLVEPNQTRSLTAGCYRGMTLKGTVTLAPGVYHIDGGPLLIESQANVTGTGVTFVMSSSNVTSNPGSVGLFEIKGGATVRLTAPTTGTYAGLLMHMDARAPLRTNYIRGSATSSLDGGFYLPSQTVSFEGSSGMSVTCLRLVSRRVTFTGTSGVNNSCPADHGFRDFVVGLQVRIVG